MNRTTKTAISSAFIDSHFVIVLLACPPFFLERPDNPGHIEQHWIPDRVRNDKKCKVFCETTQCLFLVPLLLLYVSAYIVCIVHYPYFLFTSLISPSSYGRSDMMYRKPYCLQSPCRSPISICHGTGLHVPCGMTGT